MTRSDIDILEAGPAADVAVARAKGFVDKDPNWIATGNHIHDGWAWQWDGYRFETFSPSTSIADALPLLEEMRKDYRIAIDMLLIDEVVIEWAPRNPNPTGRWRTRALSAPTLPLAIVRAYLIAADAGGGK